MPNSEGLIPVFETGVASLLFTSWVKATLRSRQTGLAELVPPTCVAWDIKGEALAWLVRGSVFYEKRNEVLDEITIVPDQKS